MWVRSVKQALWAQRGFSMTELAFVLAIAGAILSGVWYAAKSVTEQNKEAQGVQLVRDTSQGILSFMQNRTLPTGTNNSILANLVASNVIPTQYIMPTTPVTASNPWATTTNDMHHSPFNIYSGVAITNPMTTYRISLYGIPTSACVALISQLTNCTMGEGCPIEIYTNVTGNSACPPNTVQNGTCALNKAQWQLTSANINTLCAANVGATTPSVEFDFSTSN